MFVAASAQTGLSGDLLHPRPGKEEENTSSSSWPRAQAVFPRVCTVLVAVAVLSPCGGCPAAQHLPTVGQGGEAPLEG